MIPLLMQLACGPAPTLTAKVVSFDQGMDLKVTTNPGWSVTVGETTGQADERGVYHQMLPFGELGPGEHQVQVKVSHEGSSLEETVSVSVTLQDVVTLGDCDKLPGTVSIMGNVASVSGDFGDATACVVDRKGNLLIPFKAAPGVTLAAGEHSAEQVEDTLMLKLPIWPLLASVPVKDLARTRFPGVSPATVTVSGSTEGGAALEGALTLELKPTVSDLSKAMVNLATRGEPLPGAVPDAPVATLLFSEPEPAVPGLVQIGDDVALGEVDLLAVAIPKQRKKLNDCGPYDGNESTVALLQMDMHVTVADREGKIVAERNFAGDNPDCPYLSNRQPGDDRPLQSRPDMQSIKDWLQTLLDAPDPEEVPPEDLETPEASP